MERIKIDIFNYESFRKYIKDYYEVNNRADPKFSYAFLADKGGFDNRVLVYRIVENKIKRISAEHCIMLSKAFNHTPREAEYFGYLFELDQIKSEEKRSAIGKKMRAIIDGQNVKIRMIKKDKDHEAFYAELYHSVIRALIEIVHPFKEEYERLCGMSLLPVTEMQARASVELLERIGFIEQDADGIYKIITEGNIKTSREYSQKYKDDLNVKYMEAAKELIRHHSPATRKIFKSKVIGISEPTYREICRMTDEFQNKIDVLVQNEKATDRVYFYQFIFIPLTKSNAAERPSRYADDDFN
ncbi:MAG: TIGR02147 family protein [Chitinispirillaceae bacterium]|nr:TIGR02147 family protein [Chitinispirillaceae bacterium]